MIEARRRALAAMGYSEREPGKWLKPIGYQLFSYSEERNEWANWGRAMDGDLLCWERHSFVEAHDFDPVHQLKEFECWTRTDLYVRGDSRFELATLEGLT